MLKIDLEYEKEIFYIRLNGSLNHKNTKKINNYIVPVIRIHKIKNVIVNLKNLNSIDSSGIYAILNINCVTNINKGKMYLCNVKKQIKDALKYLNMRYASSEIIAKKDTRCNNGL